MATDPHAAKVEGRPELPDAWNGLLLDKPLEGKVLAVEQLQDTRPEDDYRGPIELTLSIGSKAGVLECMRFFLYEQRIWLMGRVVRVEPDRCVVEVTMSRKSEWRPRKGWTMSTRDPSFKTL